MKKGIIALSLCSFVAIGYLPYNINRSDVSRVDKTQRFSKSEHLNEEPKIYPRKTQEKMRKEVFSADTNRHQAPVLASELSGCQAYDDKGGCTRYKIDTNINNDPIAESYCLKKNDQDRCEVFTLNTNFKNIFFDEQANATKAMPILALLSASNFHEVMLNMRTVSINEEAKELQSILNQYCGQFYAAITPNSSSSLMTLDTFSLLGSISNLSKMIFIRY